MSNSPFDDPENVERETVAAVMREGQMSPPRASAISEPLPPLRLHHLFVWTAVSAVLLGLEVGSFAHLPIARWWIATKLPSVFGSALALTCCGYGLVWRRRGLPFPSQPGHGLLLLEAITYILVIAYSLVWFANAEWQPDGQVNASNLVISFVVWGQRIATICWVALALWFAWWVRPSRRWQVFFALLALVAGHYYFGEYVEAWLIEPIRNLQWIGPGLAASLHFVKGNLPHTIPGIALIVAILRDRRDRIPRHWTHWAGVAAWCVSVSGELASALVEIGWLPEPFSID